MNTKKRGACWRPALVLMGFGRLECVVNTELQVVAVNTDTESLPLVNIVNIASVAEGTNTCNECNLVRSSELHARTETNSPFSLLTVNAGCLYPETTINEEANGTCLVECVTNIRINGEVSFSVTLTQFVAAEAKSKSKVNLVAQAVADFRSDLEYVVLGCFDTVSVGVCVTEATTEPNLCVCCQSRHCYESSQKNLFHNLTFLIKS